MRGHTAQSVSLYKRHAESCLVHKTKLSAEAEKHYMDCSCPIWMVGRTPSGDIVPRQSTGCSQFKEAESVRASIIARSAKQTASDELRGPSIADCAKSYLDSKKDEVGEKTLGQHALLLDRLLEFCAKKSVLYMDGLTVDLLETFKVKGLPNGASTSKATSIAKLRCFLKDAYRRGWTKEALREKVTTHKAVYGQKEPYTDEEVDLILAEALKLDGGTHGYAKHPKTFRLLLELQLETGLRVGDAIRYDPAHAEKGEHLWVYTYTPMKQKKTEQPKPHEVYLTDDLKTAIDECEWLSPKLPFSWGKFQNKNYLANEAYYRMQAIGERCGVDDCRPHRLRDTFAVRKLLAGLTLDDVSRLLGHSSVKVTEKYYARWVRSRKLRLERLVAETLVNPVSNGGGNGKSGVRPLAGAGVAKSKNAGLGAKKTRNRGRRKAPQLG